jgi:hypothetical protein
MATPQLPLLFPLSPAQIDAKVSGDASCIWSWFFPPSTNPRR